MKLKELSVGLAVALGLTGCQSITKPTQGDPGSHDTIRLGGNWELTGTGRCFCKFTSIHDKKWIEV